MIAAFKYVAYILLLAGVLLFFFKHLILFGAFIVALGFISFIFNMIGVSLESAGDISFS